MVLTGEMYRDLFRIPCQDRAVHILRDLIQQHPGGGYYITTDDHSIKIEEVHYRDYSYTEIPRLCSDQF